MGSITASNEEIEFLYITKKLSTYELSKVFDCSQTTVRRKLKKMGLTFEKQRDSYVISDIQKDIIIGSIFGDGKVDVNKDTSSIAILHCKDQKEYCNEKFKILKSICSMNELSLRIRSHDKDANRQDQYYFNTKYIKAIKEITDTPDEELIKMLNGNILAILYFDDGNKSTRNVSPNFEIACKWMKIDLIELTIKTLNEKFNVNPVISWSDKEHTQYKGIRFNVKDTIIIDNIIKNSDLGTSLIDSMKYKLLD